MVWTQESYHKPKKYDRLVECSSEKDWRGRIQTSRPTFQSPWHSSPHKMICGLSLHQGNTESRKNLEQKFIFQISTPSLHGINERFSFN